MWKISRIVSKMQPLIDAHCGPFRDKYRYWFGGLLVARAIPLLVGVVSSTNADQNTVYSLYHSYGWSAASSAESSVQKVLCLSF